MISLYVFPLSFQHSKFTFDCLVLSLSSSIGQLFIFYTISKFGPVVFTIIMTLRQVSNRLFHPYIYHMPHPVSIYYLFLFSFAGNSNPFILHRVQPPHFGLRYFWCFNCIPVDIFTCVLYAATKIIET